MDSALTTIGLPAALGIIMLGLGLSLTIRDFTRLLSMPWTIVLILGCQIVLLPLFCFGLVLVFVTYFDLSPLLAVGISFIALYLGHISVHELARLAFASGVFGTIIGADLLHLKTIRRLGAEMVSIGGAGTFDGILLTGVIATIFAAILLSL